MNSSFDIGVSMGMEKVALSDDVKDRVWKARSERAIEAAHTLENTRIAVGIQRGEGKDIDRYWKRLREDEVDSHKADLKLRRHMHLFDQTPGKKKPVAFRGMDRAETDAMETRILNTMNPITERKINPDFKTVERFVEKQSPAKAPGLLSRITGHIGARPKRYVAGAVGATALAALAAHHKRNRQ